MRYFERLLLAGVQFGGVLVGADDTSGGEATLPIHPFIDTFLTE